MRTRTMTRRTRCPCAPLCSQSQHSQSQHSQSQHSQSQHSQSLLPQIDVCRSGASAVLPLHGCQALIRLAWQAAGCLRHAALCQAGVCYELLDIIS